MTADLCAQGGRVHVHTVREADLAPYRVAVERSRARIARWNPVNPDDLRGHLASQSRSHRTFLIRVVESEGEHDVVGKINVTGVVRGRFCSGSMGYDSYDPYAGRGLFAEGMRLVVGLAFREEPEGMGLHRLEANVQPGNVTSAGLLRAVGFRHEGFTPRMMWMTDDAGQEQWRDHDRYALTAEDWPSPPYAGQDHPRLGCLVTGPPGPGRTELARRLARELAVPLLSETAGTGPEALCQLLADSSVGGVLDVERSPTAPSVLLEIGCADGATTTTSPEPDPTERATVLSVDTSRPVADREVARLALEVRRLSASARQAPEEC